MKRINMILPVLLAILSADICAAASTSATNRVTVTRNQYTLQGDSVRVGLLIDLNGARVPRRAFVLLTPSIQKGDVAMELPPVMIDGKNRHKAYRRLVAIGREPMGAGQVINVGQKDAPLTYFYSASVPYEPWMRDAQFSVHEDQCECNGPLVKMSYNLISDPMQEFNQPVATTYRDVRLNFVASFKEPSPEPIKMRSETGKAYLDFAAGSAELRPYFKNNAAELARIDDMIRKVKYNPAITITRIIIDGYASPEDSYATNLTLSGRRANALKDYIRSIYGIPGSLFRVTGRGEDWTGLRDIVAASDVAYSNAALWIIDGMEDFDTRERKLKELQGGAPYSDMFYRIFPMLRRTDYQLQYTVLPFSVEQGKRTLETNPSLLSLNEMFLIAQSYPAGSAEFHRVFDIAARTYPDSDIANFNAAANAISAGDITAAGQYLKRVATRDAALENNLGIMAALQGDYDTAAWHFANAMREGNPEAAQNLGQIDKLKEKPK